MTFGTWERFDGLGAEVTIIQRSHTLLRAEDHDIAHAYTRAASERYDVRLDTIVAGSEEMTDCTRLHLLEGNKGPLFVHPALTEVVEQTLLALID